MQEDQERVELEKRLALMVPTAAWMNPLPNDAASPAEMEVMPAPPARGEDSTEAAAAAAWRQQVRCERDLLMVQWACMPSLAGCSARSKVARLTFVRVVRAGAAHAL